MICSLYPSMFTESEHEVLKSPFYSVSTFRYQSGVEAVRVHAGRGEFVWLPYLGQQIWDWRIDGKNMKFSGFVDKPAYGKNFLQNYGGFLVHCGMTAMGNPGPQDAHLHHGELPIAVFDEAWIEIRHEGRIETLCLSGSLHWHVPFVAEYRCTPTLLISPDGLSLSAEVRLENLMASDLEYMYLAHINFAFSEARLSSTIPFDQKRVDIRNEIIQGMAANPETIKKIDSAAVYEPELVAIINAKDSATGEGVSAGSILARGDGTAFWVSQETSVLDHYVLWITHNADRGACGFHLPSTAGPRGKMAEKALGNMKSLPPGGVVTLQYACGFSDSAEKTPVQGAR